MPWKESDKAKSHRTANSFGGSRARQKSGFGGRFDVGEQGYIDNFRRNTERPRYPINMVRRCSKCRKHKPLKGGYARPGYPFKCAECRS